MRPVLPGEQAVGLRGEPLENMADDGPSVDGVRDGPAHFYPPQDGVGHVETQIGEVGSRAAENFEARIGAEPGKDVGRESILEHGEAAAFEFEDTDCLLGEDSEDQAVEFRRPAEIVGVGGELDSLVRIEALEAKRPGADRALAEFFPGPTGALGHDSHHEGVRERGGGLLEIKNHGVRRRSLHPVQLAKPGRPR